MRETGPPSLRGIVERQRPRCWVWRVEGSSGRVYAGGEEGNHPMAMSSCNEATGALRGAWMFMTQDVRKEAWS